MSHFKLKLQACDNLIKRSDTAQLIGSFGSSNMWLQRNGHRFITSSETEVWNRISQQVHGQESDLLRIRPERETLMSNFAHEPVILHFLSSSRNISVFFCKWNPLLEAAQDLCSVRTQNHCKLIFELQLWFLDDCEPGGNSDLTHFSAGADQNDQIFVLESCTAYWTDWGPDQNKDGLGPDMHPRREMEKKSDFDTTAENHHHHMNESPCHNMER